MIQASTRTVGGKNLSAAIRKGNQAKGVDSLHVGFFSSARYPDGTPVTNVAVWQNFGTRKPDGTVHIPARPFFNNGIEAAEPKVEKLLADVDPQTLVVDKRMAALIGEVVKEAIQTSIRDLRDPELADITVKGGWMRNPWTGQPVFIKGKKSDNPLIDTAFMRGTVSYEVQQ